MHDFIRILNGAVPLDMSNNRLPMANAVRLGYYDRDLENEKTAHWVLGAASSDRTYVRIVNIHVVIHRAWATLLVVLFLQSSSWT